MKYFIFTFFVMSCSSQNSGSVYTSKKPSSVKAASTTEETKASLVLEDSSCVVGSSLIVNLNNPAVAIFTSSVSLNNVELVAKAENLEYKLSQYGGSNSSSTQGIKYGIFIESPIEDTVETIQLGLVDKNTGKLVTSSFNLKVIYESTDESIRESQVGQGGSKFFQKLGSGKGLIGWFTKIFSKKDETTAPDSVTPDHIKRCDK